MILPIVAVASLAGLSFLKRRPESNGHAPPGPRTPEERMPRIMAALAAGAEASVSVLAQAVQEARALGMAGAAAIFEGALARALAAKKAEPPAEPPTEAPLSDADSRTVEEILDLGLGEDVPEVSAEPAGLAPPDSALPAEDASIVPGEETSFEVGEPAVKKKVSAGGKAGPGKSPKGEKE